MNRRSFLTSVAAAALAPALPAIAAAPAPLKAANAIHPTKAGVKLWIGDSHGHWQQVAATLERLREWSKDGGQAEITGACEIRLDKPIAIPPDGMLSVRIEWD